MTYNWIIPAPEFDSGAEKELNKTISKTGIPA